MKPSDAHPGQRLESNEDRAEGADADSSWTVQSSSKTRRLVPQHTITRQELGADNSKTKPHASEPVKKKVIRFTKDELINRRKEEAMLSSIANMTEILSAVRQDPVAFTKLDPDDVLRLWSNHNKETTAARGRGRGRGRTDEGTGETEWSKGTEDRKNDPWSNDFADAGDLSDLAAAALNFRSQLSSMALDRPGEDQLGDEEEDMMVKLLKEQSDAAKAEEFLDESEEMPAWASSTITTKETTLETKMVIAVVSQPEPAPIAPIEPAVTTTATAFSMGVNLFSDLGGRTANVSKLETFSLLEAAAPPAPLLPVEWFYMDPQNKVQGPFTQETMRLWNEGGYFPRDLPIKLRNWTGFHAFSDIYENSRTAFFSVPPEPRLHSSLLGLSSTFGSAATLSSSQSRPVAPAMAPATVQHVAPQYSASQLYYTETKVTAQSSASVKPVESVAQESSLLDRMRSAPATTAPTTAASFTAPSHTATIPAAPVASTAASAAATQATPAERLMRTVNVAPQATPSPQPYAVGHSVAKSDFAKQLLGIASKSTGVERPAQERAPPPAPAAPTPVVAPAAPTPVVHSVSTESGTASAQAIGQSSKDKEVQQAKASPVKGWNKNTTAAPSLSLTEIQQQEEEARSKEKLTHTPATAPAAAGSAPASMSVQLKSLLGVKPVTTATAAKPSSIAGSPAPWSTVSASSAGASASLRDIMLEEEITVQQREANKSWSGSTGSSWAAKAKPLHSVPPSAVPHGAESHRPSGPPATMAKIELRSTPQDFPVANAATASAPATVQQKQQQQQQQQQHARKERSEFGGRQMSKEMEDWCGAQLKRITGSDDLTLMHFCMSLGSATDIRETLASYLGSSPQVSNFATDFIKYRDEGKRPIVNPFDKSSIVDHSGRTDPTRSNTGFISASKKKKPVGK